MASLHRRPNTKYFYAAWRGQGGRLFLRSTSQTERSAAMKVALSYERAAKLAMRGELTEAVARKVLNDILESTSTGDSLRSPTVAAWLREWLAEKTASKSDTTAIRYAGTVELFLEYLGDRAKRPLTALSPRDLQGFIAHRQKAGCAPATVQVDGKILRTALNRARRQGLILSNPGEALDLPARNSIERGTFNASEVKMLLDTAKDEWRTMILFGYYTGARLGDCCKMTWEMVDLVGETLQFKQEKTGGPSLVIPLHPELLAHLSALAGTDSSEKFIMPKLAEKDVGGRNGLSKHFLRIVDRAGLDRQQVQGAGMRKLSRRSFHALRHSFTSALANAGVSPELRMKLTGHKSAAVHAGYSHMELETLRAAVGKLPALSR